MGIKGKRPHEGSRGNHWILTKIERGKAYQGYIAGDAFCLDVHCSRNGSKPCLKHYLGPGTKCPGCDSRLRIGWLAYQPVYWDHDASAGVVPLHTSQESVIDRAVWGQRVEIGRPKGGANPGLYMTLLSKGKEYVPDRDYREKEVDITAWLIVMWKYQPYLTVQHLLDGPGWGANAVVHDTPKPLMSDDEGEAYLRKLRDEGRHLSPPETPAEQAVLSGKVLDYIVGDVPAARAIKNGKAQAKGSK